MTDFNEEIELLDLTEFDRENDLLDINQLDTNKIKAFENDLNKTGVKTKNDSNNITILNEYYKKELEKLKRSANFFNRKKKEIEDVENKIKKYEDLLKAITTKSDTAKMIIDSLDYKIYNEKELDKLVKDYIICRSVVPVREIDEIDKQFSEKLIANATKYAVNINPYYGDTVASTKKYFTYLVLFRYSIECNNKEFYENAVEMSEQLSIFFDDKIDQFKLDNEHNTYLIFNRKCSNANDVAGRFGILKVYNKVIDGKKIKSVSLKDVSLSDLSYGSPIERRSFETTVFSDEGEEFKGTITYTNITARDIFKGVQSNNIFEDTMQDFSKKTPKEKKAILNAIKSEAINKKIEAINNIYFKDRKTEKHI